MGPRKYGVQLTARQWEVLQMLDLHEWRFLHKGDGVSAGGMVTDVRPLVERRERVPTNNPFPWQAQRSNQYRLTEEGVVRVGWEHLQRGTVP